MTILPETAALLGGPLDGQRVTLTVPCLAIERTIMPAIGERITVRYHRTPHVIADGSTVFEFKPWKPGEPTSLRG